jgi:excisionase family DNA binding protein
MRQEAKGAPLESMLTVRQVSEFLHVSICTVRRWSNKGMLKYYRVGSRGDRRYRREDVLRFLEESSNLLWASESESKLKVR